VAQKAEKTSTVAIAMQLVTIQTDHTTAPTNQDFMGMAVKVTKNLAVENAIN